MKKILFREEQRFSPWWLWLILGSALLAITIPLSYEFSAQLWDTSSENLSRLILNGGLAALIVVAVLIVLVMRKLKTKITYDEIIINFPPMKRKSYRIKIKEIERFEIRQYKPMREYGGYGFRSKRKSGQAYIISGNTGLQLYFKNGKKLLIGTQKKQAIEFAMCKIVGEDKSFQHAKRRVSKWKQKLERRQKVSDNSRN